MFLPKIGIFGLLLIGAITSVLGDISLQRHINSVATKSGTLGCRKKPLDTFSLIGPAKACTNSKPLKLAGVLKMGKNICAENWNICSITDKAVQKLSWKSHKMPKGCFAFNYGKAKAAGYGQSCHANLYFDGVLCCPKVGSKAAHHQKKKISTNDINIHDKFRQQLNFVK